jgi:uncharacterized SAM-binding protein YcdF (DUF218 family)
MHRNGMDDDIVGKEGVRLGRQFRFSLKPARIVALLLLPWALAGCFMGGDDALPNVIPWLVVLGGGVAQERIETACGLYKEGYGRSGVILTGTGAIRAARERTVLVRDCGIPDAQIAHWSAPTDTFEELSAVATMLADNPDAQAIVVSDSLHMPRLRYIRDRLGLEDRMYLRQSRLGGKYDPAYLAKVVVFWFREPLAYVYYRLRY